MTNISEKLEQLSAAATQGEWFSVEIKGHAGWSQVGSTVDDHKEWPCGDAGDNDAPFIVALVNLYRKGQLVVAQAPESWGNWTETDYPSCQGQNTSCPDGCGRDPETGELNGTKLVAVQADDATVERVARAILKAHALDTTGFSYDAAEAIADHAVQSWMPEAKTAISALAAKGDA